jgi:hypothetical protein
VSWACVSAGRAEVYYSGFPNSDTGVVIFFVNSLGSPNGGTFAMSGGAGAQAFQPVATLTSGQITSKPSNILATLSPSFLNC